MRRRKNQLGKVFKYIPHSRLEDRRTDLMIQKAITIETPICFSSEIVTDEYYLLKDSGHQVSLNEGYVLSKFRTDDFGRPMIVTTKFERETEER